MRYIPCLTWRVHTIVPIGNHVRLSIYTPLIPFGDLSRPYLLLITLCFYFRQLEHDRDSTAELTSPRSIF